MKSLITFITCLLILVIISCKKDNSNTYNTSDNYGSIADFFSKNKPAIQTFTVSGINGGIYTSPQGTTVSIPPNAFQTQSSNTAISGNVTIQFIDLYKKSDMLLSDMPPMTYYGSPLKSGGEFFIKAVSNNNILILASGKKITITQPTSLTGGIDTDNPMQAFAMMDSIPVTGTGLPNFIPGWDVSPTDSVFTSATNYVYSLYQFGTPADSGTWCNSDNTSFFSAYPNTMLTLAPADSVNLYHTNTFLVFTNVNSMVHVYYNNYQNNFIDFNVPQGLQCTLVAIGVKNGKLYSSFVPFTVGTNQTIPFSLTITTTSAFINKLNALN